MPARIDDDDDWVGTPPEGRHARDRAHPEFWWRQRPILPAATAIVVVVVALVLVLVLRWAAISVGMEHNEMTAEGLEALRAELERLEGEGRRQIAEQIRTAREWGDLKENAEYHAAKEAQAHLETRIAQVRQRLAGAEVVEVSTGDVVGFGSTVEVEDLASGRHATYRLVAAQEAAPAEGRLSVESPVAAALRDRRAGDETVVDAPGGERRLRVVAVR